MKTAAAMSRTPNRTPNRAPKSRFMGQIPLKNKCTKSKCAKECARKNAPEKSAKKIGSQCTQM
jgi:hypothetical protein